MNSLKNLIRSLWWMKDLSQAFSSLDLQQMLQNQLPDKIFKSKNSMLRCDVGYENLWAVVCELNFVGRCISKSFFFVKIELWKQQVLTLLLFLWGNATLSMEPLSAQWCHVSFLRISYKIYGLTVSVPWFYLEAFWGNDVAKWQDMWDCTVQMLVLLGNQLENLSGCILLLKKPS